MRKWEAIDYASEPHAKIQTATVESNETQLLGPKEKINFSAKGMPLDMKRIHTLSNLRGASLGIAQSGVWQHAFTRFLILNTWFLKGGWSGLARRGGRYRQSRLCSAHAQASHRLTYTSRVELRISNRRRSQNEHEIGEGINGGSR